MLPRTVHHTLWLAKKISEASGDICIVCGDQDEADFVRAVMYGSPVAVGVTDQNFRIMTPRSDTSLVGRNFDQIIVDETAGFGSVAIFEWYQRSVQPRLKSGGLELYYPK